MRNLKRALSLALASVMLVGMMVVGTSASYNDVTTENNVEAIEVLKTVGIMVGDENGNFNPDNLVTRQEMAVVMSNLMDYRVASYKGTAPFGDVADWAEPYVAACYTNGITAGMGEGYYGATENVTTAQAALMLMKALGYFQYGSDFGSDWQLATVKQANKIELFDDVDAGVKEAITRNELAQLVLNTLESGMVEADDDTIKVNTGDTTVEAGKVNYEYVTSSKPYASTIGTTLGSSSTSGSTQGNIVELGEKLYDGDLKKVSSTATDAYGRPATRWDYKLDKIGDFAKDPIAVYTAKVTKGTLYDLIGKDRLDDVSKSAADFTYAIDGASTTVTGAAFDAIKTSYFLNNSSLAVAKSAANEAGKGVVTEVYLDSKTGDITIVTINAYVMKATSNYNENKDELQVSVKTGSASATKLSGEDFDIADYAKDDYILYTYVNGAIEDIYPATTIQGEVTAYSVNNNVTLDGTKYDYALRIHGDSKTTEYRVGDTAAVVLDQYGYVVFVDDAAVSMGNYLYVDGIAKNSGLGTDYLAKVYFTDGTKDEIVIDKLYAYGASSKTDLSSALTTSTPTWDGWYTYSKDSSDEYTLRAVKSGAQNKATSGTITGEAVAFASGLKGNSNSIMIVDDTDDVTVYTGINNFPDVSSTTLIAGLKEKADDTKTYTGVVIVKTSDSANVTSKANDTMLYVLKEDTHYVNTEDNERIDVMHVILNGEKTKVECKNGDLVAGTLYSKVKVDEDGYYEGTQVYSDLAAANASDKYISYKMGSGSSSSVVAYSAGTLTLGTQDFIVGEDTQITLVLDAKNSWSSAVGKMKTEIMTDPDADFEYVSDIEADTLKAMMDGWKLTASVNVIKDAADSEIAETIVLVVAGVVAK